MKKVNGISAAAYMETPHARVNLNAAIRQMFLRSFDFPFLTEKVCLYTDGRIETVTVFPNQTWIPPDDLVIVLCEYVYKDDLLDEYIESNCETPEETAELFLEYAGAEEKALWEGRGRANGLDRFGIARWFFRNTNAYGKAFNMIRLSKMREIDSKEIVSQVIGKLTAVQKGETET